MTQVRAILLGALFIVMVACDDTTSVGGEGAACSADSECFNGLFCDPALGSCQSLDGIRDRTDVRQDVPGSDTSADATDPGDGVIQEGACESGETAVCGVSQVGVCETAVQTCVEGQWSACAAIFPTEEVCDGLDNDCDGSEDEQLQEDCGLDEGACQLGVRTCNAGVWGSCKGGIDPADERCGDGVDNDCDGRKDEPDDAVDAQTYYIDRDDDGFGDESAEGVLACAPPTAQHVPDNTDCDETNREIHPGAEEVCDAVDNNCADGADEGLDTFFYADLDVDGYGDPDEVVVACKAPANYVEDNTDCDPERARVYPNAPEICDGLDNDCDDLVDGDDPDATLQPATWYRDQDNDGFGDPNTTQDSCTQPEGFVDNELDCLDSNFDIKPTAIEVCDAVDNDCDASTHDGAEASWLGQACDGADGDLCNEGQLYCDSSGAQACDDLTDTIVEVCNGADDDCNGERDEGVGNTYYADTDNDGYGDPDTTTVACSPPSGYLEDNTDCDDTGPNAGEIHPNATEICDEVDNNCVGGIDEGVKTTFYDDTDNDGYGDPSLTAEACTLPAGYADNADDCDPSRSTVYPLAAELCDGLDNDCDGSTADGSDEGWFGNPCDGPDTDDCNEGSLGCDGSGAQICSDATDDTLEICDDNIDNDCDTRTDEGCVAGAPVAECGALEVVTAPGEAVQLDGSGSTDPDSPSLTFTWSVLSAPGGSTAAPNPAVSSDGLSAFSPDAVGSYTLQLTVEDGDGNADSCTVTVTAVGLGALHVQLEWEEIWGDLDLHLTRANLPPLGTFMNDDWPVAEACWFRAQSSDWGAVGSADGDVALDVDDQDGYGPENLEILSNPEVGTYHVGVHFFCAHSATARKNDLDKPLHGRVRIYCAGVLIDEIPTSTTYRQLTRVGDFWIPAKIDWTGSTCTVTRIDTVEYGVKYCVAAGTCTPGGTNADSGDCIQRETTCDFDSDCRNYETCDFFNDCALNGACTVDGDCPSGQTCDVVNLGGICVR